MFKEKFKYFKSKCPPPDLSQVVHLNSPNPQEVRHVQIERKTYHDSLVTFGFKKIDSWEVFELVNHPGLLILKNAFTPYGQRYWIKKCLEEYTKPPNKNNLTPHGLLKEYEDWWDICHSDFIRREKLLKQLRWVTLGYHHNWDTKVYTEDSKGVFPPELNEMCQILGQIVGGWTINAEAAIINFYHMDSTLSGHTDHSEPNNNAPLFSFSFGQSAIFLIGGPNIEDDATGILVESGDCVVMSSKSRLSYHGVPRIVKAKSPTWLDTSQPPDWSNFDNYINESRINMNIRQVLFEGQNRLDS